jgi:nucleoid-associated protein YgaU
MHLARSRRVGGALVASTFALLLVAGVADAHIVKTFGKYTVALGWVHEPTYVGEQNAVQVVIKDAAGKAITDLNDGDLKVTVAVGGQTSDPLPLLNTFDPDTGLGVAGDYEAPIIPTAPGDYTFHLTGTIDGTPVDETATSSDSTFNSAIDATGIQFPNKLPALTDIITRLDRIDARLSPSAAPSSGAAGASGAPAQTDVDAAEAEAASAQSAANNALLVGAGIGSVGLIVGLLALTMAMRTRRPAG